MIFRRTLSALWLALLSASARPATIGVAPEISAPPAATASLVPAPTALTATAPLEALSPAVRLSPATLSPPAALAAAPVADAARAAPAVVGTETGIIRTPSVAAGLAALRSASYPDTEDSARIVAAIKRAHPELPISSANLFLVRDQDMLERLGIPDNAAGAARIVSDGRSEIPVVILVARRGIGLDDFVEFATHEAVHLMDDGILRVTHDQELKHFFAEGWTQTRAVAMANDALAELGRPPTPGRAYHREIALTDAFARRYGTAALDELVRRGRDAGLREALGSRWSLAEAIVASPASREKRLNALIALVNADAVGPADERTLRDYLGL